ncbi:MAG: HEAT repeat domain-containing protein [Vicinamibacteraceae bacterium]
MKQQALIIGLGWTLAVGAPCGATAAIPPGAGIAVVDDGEQTRENELYESARQAIDEEQWRRAVDGFERVVALKGPKADLALYWKAYAQNRANLRADALDTLAALKKAYPKSRSLEEARALEMDIRNAGGQAVAPAAIQDEDLKLYALQALGQQDPAQAVPLLEKTLRGAGSTKLRERALFVLAQMSDPRARKLLTDTAKDDAHPEVQSKAIQYLGVHGGGENRALLAEVYQSSTNVSVKKRVLQAWMVAGERDRIMTAATGETDPELRAAAIQQLGVMGAHDELASLYARETVKEVKGKILQAMFIGGRADRLIELAKSEPDPDLRRKAIRNLGLMGKEKTGTALVEIYGADRDPAVKKAVIEGLFLQSHADALVVMVRKETDPELKRSIVEKLSLMQGSKVAMDYLMELLK